MKEMTDAEVTGLLEVHHEYFDSQVTKNVAFRIDQLKKLKVGMLKYEQAMMDALKSDLGKHPVESYATEIGFVYRSITDTIRHIKKWAKPVRVKTPIFLMPSRSHTLYEPYGTVLIMGPYNYPLQLMLEPLVGVIAAGNCAVLKPSEIAPQVSRVVAEMIDNTFDRNYISCIEGTVETNTLLINAKFDYIFFTGSAGVGRIVKEAAAKNLVPSTLELGGKSPVIVDESANIKETARRIMWGKTLNAGQTCVAPDYVLVHDSVKNELICEMKNCLQLYYGNDIKYNNSYGRIINESHFDRITTMMEKDKAGIVFGGKSDRSEKFIEPTLIEISSWNAATMKEEIFGPVLPLIAYEDLDSAIQNIKKLPKPLALYLFTTRMNVERKVISEISSGGVCINDVISHVANSNLPFGGVGNAGMGSYHGKQSFITFSHCKSILKKPHNINNTLAYPSYTEKKMTIIKKFLK
ncbi:aldehyde dehydrogenase family protein [Acetobacterium paludosum]|uniref:Aldehyde dehydrogenase n=1 Tax=Acetobacterium paludosum TaxID=52693 RepID=A0A923HXK1_9FIRM|nr:aldehyde dehydrogenase [Acetobacterium paludosum]MBC3888987.1 aldehyde dehydrogenase family protein [Acetobacterium paludosum]